MAKSQSEIVAENKAKRAEEAEIQASRDEIHQRQMEELEAITSTSEKPVNETQDLTYYAVPAAFSVVGFVLGILVTSLFFKKKIRKLKQEYEIRINESRTSLDRIIELAASSANKK